MRRVRILAALAAAMLVVGVLPATAQDADTLPQQDDNGLRFIATADGGGFDVSIAEESLSVGVSEAGIQSSPDGEACDNALACALGAGELLLGETAEVSISEGSASDDASALDLSDVPLLSGSIGQAVANAQVEGGITSADAEGGVLEAELGLTGDLDDVLEGDLEETLTDLLGGLLDTDQLGELGELDPELLEGLTDLLDLDPGQLEGLLGGFGLGSQATAQSTNPEDVTAEEITQALLEAAEADGSGGGSNEVEDTADALAGEADGSGGDEPSADEVQAIVQQLLDDSAQPAQVDPGDLDPGELEQLDPEGLLGGVVETITDLLEDPTSAALVQVGVGPTDSQTESDGATTSAAANAQGAVVVVLPTPDSTIENPAGLVTLELGSSSASVNSDGSAANADFDPALARVGLALPLLSEGDVETIEVAPGESQCLGSAPLELCVSVGDGDTTVADGGASASANAVAISALGDPLPELAIDLAAVTAAVNADADLGPAEEPTEEPEPDEQLPVTGGGPLLPGLVLLGAGLAGFVGLRRRV